MSSSSDLPTPTFAEFLQTYPLYKQVQIPIGTHKSQSAIFYPKRIALYCDSPQCKREMEWQTWSYENETSAGVAEVANYGNTTRSYTCKHCDANTVEFFL